MKFVELLSLSVVFCSIVSSVNASGACELGFARQCGDNVVYSCSYARNGVVEDEARTSDIDKFVDTINNLHGDVISVSGIERESVNVNTNAYIIGDGNSVGDIMVFDKLKTDDISTLKFNGSNFCGQPLSLQFNYDNASDMNLPYVNCKNIALLKFNVSNKSDDKCVMKGFNTDVMTGFAYNNKLKINGKTYNNVVSDITKGDLCMFTDSGVDKMKQFTGSKVNLGKPFKKEKKESEKYYEKNGLSKYINKAGVPIRDVSEKDIVRKIYEYKQMLRGGK